MMKTLSTALFLVIVLLLNACGGGGGGDQGPIVNIPTAPTGVTATAQFESLQLSWTGTGGATNYNVYWSDAGGVTTGSNKLSDVTSPTTLDGLTADTPYYIRVSALNGAGESALSAETMATPYGLPLAVQSITTQPDSGRISVSWSSSAYTDSYNVYWSTTAGAGTSASVVNTASTSIDLTGLINGTTYYITVQSVNAGGTGALSAEASATPVVAGQSLGWSEQLLINTPYDFFGRDNYLGDIAINDGGVAAVGWIVDGSGDDEDDQVYINHTASGNWGTQEALTDGGSNDVAVAVTPAGDIFVAWIQYSLDVNNFRTGSTIQSRFYRAGAWSSVETLATVVDGSGVFALQIELTADGENNVIASWTEDQNTVWVNRYDAVAGWQGATLISTSIRLVQTPVAGASATDDVVLVWLQDTQPYDSGQTAGGPRQPRVYASHFDGSAWSTASPIGHGDLVGFEGAERLRIDVNPNGSAVAVWQQGRDVTDGTNYRIDALRFDAAAASWSAPETIVARDWQTSWPQVAIDAAGRAIASWQPADLADNSSTRKLDTSVFDTGSASWGAVQTVNIDDGVTEPDPLLVEMRENGDVFATWQEPGLSGGVYFRRYDVATSSWDDIATLGVRYGAGIRLAMSRNGHSIVATNPLRVSSSSFEYTVYAAIFTP